MLQVQNEVIRNICVGDYVDFIPQNGINKHFNQFLNASNSEDEYFMGAFAKCHSYGRIESGNKRIYKRRSRKKLVITSNHEMVHDIVEKNETQAKNSIHNDAKSIIRE